jgi:hypothetical protein
MLFLEAPPPFWGGNASDDALQHRRVGSTPQTVGFTQQTVA